MTVLMQLVQPKAPPVKPGVETTLSAIAALRTAHLKYAY
jgi:hypothetical protein